MTGLPFPLTGAPADRLASAIDVEGKVVRALESLGPLSGRDVLLLGDPVGPFASGLAEAGARLHPVPSSTPLRLEVPDDAVDAVISLWSGFRGVDPDDLAEVDRAVRPGGRLLVVHDYGRDDVSGLRDPDAPEYRTWSRREGPFLRGGFRIRVVHGFWTFPSVEDAAGFLDEAFGDRGRDVAGRLKRPRLTWNVAVYHRDAGGTLPVP